MISKYSHKEVLWVDLENQNDIEIERLSEDYKIPEFFTKKLKIKDFIPSMDLLDGFIFLSIAVPDLNRDTKISFISGDNILITTHSKKIEQISQLSKNLEINISLDENYNVRDSDFIMIGIIKRIHEEGINRLSKIGTTISDVNIDYRDVLKLKNYFYKTIHNIEMNKEVLLNLSKLIKSEEIPLLIQNLEIFKKDIKIYSSMLDNAESALKEKMETIKQRRKFAISFVLILFIIMVFYIIWQ